MPIPPVSTHLWGHWLLTSLALMRQHYWRWTLTASTLSTANLMQTSSHTDPTRKWKDHPRTPPRTKGLQDELALREISKLRMWRRQHCHSFTTSSPEVFPGRVSNIFCFIWIWSNLIHMVQLKNKDRYRHICPDRMKWGQKTEHGQSQRWHNFQDKILAKTISLTPQLMEKHCPVKSAESISLLIKDNLNQP